LLAESIKRLEGNGQTAQEGMAETFKSASEHIENAGHEVQEVFSRTEKQIADSDSLSRKLVASADATTDAAVLDDRDALIEELHTHRQQAGESLAKQIEEHCKRLEECSRTQQDKLLSNREQQAQSVRDSAKQSLSVIRDAIHESFESIQMIREKHLE
jgi:hypothetical protein